MQIIWHRTFYYSNMKGSNNNLTVMTIKQQSKSYFILAKPNYKH